MNGENVKWLISHTDRFFVVRSSEKKSDWRSDFLSERVSTHGPTFYRRQNIRPTLRFFIGVSFGTHGPIFLSELLCVTMAGEVPLLDYDTPIFYWTDVCACRPIFCRKQLQEKIGPIFCLTRSQRTRTDFHSDKSVCVRWALQTAKIIVIFAHLSTEWPEMIGWKETKIYEWLQKIIVTYNYGTEYRK